MDGRRRWLAGGTLALGALVVAEGIRTVATMRRVVNEDQTVLWSAARAWGRLSPRVPNFWGQAYGSTLEAVPIEILRRLGVGLTTATPAVLTALSLAGWLALAMVAWRRGHPRLALATPAVALLSGAFYWLFAAFYAPAAGRFLAVGGAAIALAVPGPRAVGSGVAIAGLGAAIDPSALLVAAPLLGLVWPLPARRLVSAAAPGALWLAGTTWFNRRHPELRYWGTGAGGLELGGLRRALAHPGRLFGLFAPEPWRAWFLPAGATLAVVVWGVTRGGRARAAAISVATLTALVAASGRASLDLQSRFFPTGRLLLALPFGLWLVAVGALETQPRAPRLARLARLARAAGDRVAVASLGALLVAALAAVGLRTIDRGARVAAIVAAGRDDSYGLTPARYVVQDCARVERLRGRRGLAVFYVQFWLAYACDALGSTTLAPLDERRPWRLAEERATRRSRLVIWGIGAEACAVVRTVATSCRVDAPAGSPPIAIVAFAPQDAVSLLAAARLPIRPLRGVRQGIPR